MSKQEIIRFLPRNLAFIMVIACLSCSTEAPLEWQQLFNGQNLDGWTMKIRYHELGDNYANTFRVNDGQMQVRYEDGYENGFEETFGHIFYEKPFSTYLLGVEYRFVGEQVSGGPGWAYRNSGMMLHGQDPTTMEKDQDFPNSIEVQLLGGNGSDDRTTANLCTPGTQFVKDGEVIKTHCIQSSSQTYHNDQWVRAEVLVLGDSLFKHFVNGEEVLSYEKPQNDDGELISGGTISLQSESHPVDFRKVEIINLEHLADQPEKLQKAIDRLLSEKRVAQQ